MQKIKGACLCESVRYESDGPVAVVATCHCTHCQKQSGSAFSVNVVVPMATLRLEGNSLATFDDVGDSGLPVRRHFCRRCGSPIHTVLDSMPGMAVIKAGTLNDPSWVRPQVELWCLSAQPWTLSPANTDRFDQNPPAQ